MLAGLLHNKLARVINVSFSVRNWNLEIGSGLLLYS